MNPTLFHGGDGYSGGAYYDHAGGSDGSDGEGDYGGHGTGEDVTKYQFFAFEISPGQGASNAGSFGGGGGGILVNGLIVETENKDMVVVVEVTPLNSLESSSLKFSIEVCLMDVVIKEEDLEVFMVLLFIVIISNMQKHQIKHCKSNSRITNVCITISSSVSYQNFNLMAHDICIQKHQI